MKKYSTKTKGFSLLELIVATAIFMILVGGMAVVASGSGLTNLENDKRLQAHAMLVETWEALKSIRNNNWATFTNGAHGLTFGGGTWAFSGASDLNLGITRSVTISDIRRDAGGNIVPSGGTIDSDSKAIQIDLSWNPTKETSQSISTNSYIHNYLAPLAWPNP